MGILDFMKDAGREVNEANKAQEIQQLIKQQLGDQILDLNVDYDKGGTVRLGGKVRYFATKQKAALLAGNIKGVEKVDDNLVVDKSQNTPAAQPSKAASGGQDNEMDLYTIQKGDTLSEIAQRYYRDANAWQRIVDANEGVIENPDRIYPGQKIRIPQ